MMLEILNSNNCTSWVKTHKSGIARWIQKGSYQTSKLPAHLQSYIFSIFSNLQAQIKNNEIFRNSRHTPSVPGPLLLIYLFYTSISFILSLILNSLTCSLTLFHLQPLIIIILAFLSMLSTSLLNALNHWVGNARKITTHTVILTKIAIPRIERAQMSRIGIKHK